MTEVDISSLPCLQTATAVELVELGRFDRQISSEDRQQAFYRLQDRIMAACEAYRCAWRIQLACTEALDEFANTVL